MTQDQIDALKAYYSNPTTDKIQPNFDDVKTVADNILKVIALADAILDSVFETVDTNIDDIKINATQSANISTLVSIKDTMTSLVNDKATLDSLYADKTTLDGLYALKSKIDSLFADKTKLNSIYDDKSILDSIYSKLSEITTVVENITEIVDSSSNATIATNKALEAKGFRDEAESFKNQAQAIAGGEVLAEDVKFSDDSNLEDYKTSILNISDVIDNLTSIDANKPLSANQGKILKDAIDVINTLLSSDDTTLDQMQEIVNYIKQNKTDLQNLDYSNIAETATLLHFTSTLKTKLDALPLNNELTTLLNAKANISDVYTKSEVDVKLLNVSGGGSSIQAYPRTEQINGSYTIDGTDLTLTSGLFSIFNGYTLEGGAENQIISASGPIVPSNGWIEGKTNYIKIYPDGSTQATGSRPSWGMYEKESADDNRDVFINGKWYPTSGGDLVTNGTFDSDILGWTASNASIVWSSADGGVLDHNYSIAGAGTAKQSISVEIGKQYTINVMTRGSNNDNSTGILQVGTTDGASDIGSEEGGSLQTWETLSITFTASTSTVYITLSTGSGGTRKVYFDNASSFGTNPTIGTAYTNQFTYLNNEDGKLLGVTASSGDVADLDYDYDAPSFITETIQANKLIVNNIKTSLPTVDPFIEGAHWNDNGTEKISAGV